MHSVSFSNETNVFVQFFADWFVQVAACIAYYIMAWTLTVFFIGTCLYLSGLKENLRIVLSDKSRAVESDYSTGFVGAAVFHNEIIEYVRSSEACGYGKIGRSLQCLQKLSRGLKFIHSIVWDPWFYGIFLKAQIDLIKNVLLL